MNYKIKRQACLDLEDREISDLIIICKAYTKLKTEQQYSRVAALANQLITMEKHI